MRRVSSARLNSLECSTGRKLPLAAVGVAIGPVARFDGNPSESADYHERYESVALALCSRMGCRSVSMLSLDLGSGPRDSRKGYRFASPPVGLRRPSAMRGSQRFASLARPVQA